MEPPDWKLDAEKKTAIFPGNPPVTFDLATLEVLLQAFGSARAAMHPAVTRESPLGRAVYAVVNPLCSAESEPLLGNLILHIRDPRFGWLHYQFSKDDARKLGTFLVEQAGTPPASPQGEL